MVRLTPTTHAGGDHQLGSMPLAIGLFISVSALVALCAKHARRRVSRENAATPHDDSKVVVLAPKSPLRSPKQLMATISNKAIIPFILHHWKTDQADEAAEINGGGEEADEGFGAGGLWQKSILMGEKCQPPEFSGVIYYDYCGNPISELPPRSPRASLLPSFSFPVPKDEN